MKKMALELLLIGMIGLTGCRHKDVSNNNRYDGGNTSEYVSEPKPQQATGMFNKFGKVERLPENYSDFGFAADMDGDGDLDIVTVSNGNVSIYENNIPQKSKTQGTYDNLSK
jgi:hypothetical protein